MISLFPSSVIVIADQIGLVLGLKRLIDRTSYTQPLLQPAVASQLWKDLADVISVCQLYVFSRCCCSGLINFLHLANRACIGN